MPGLSCQFSEQLLGLNDVNQCIFSYLDSMRKGKTVKFKNQSGEELAGVLELPLDQQPRHFALFAHCFTCGKDLKVSREITGALHQAGIAVLRFDFTGLGQSGGDFSEKNFSSNLTDLQAACDFLSKHYQAPQLLVGHSLGGTAVLMAATHMPEVKAVATIGAPSTPEHLLHLLKQDMAEIESSGSAEVDLGGRSFCIKKQFIEDLRSQDLAEELSKLEEVSFLVLHAPEDKVVAIDNARHLYEALQHPKSFIGLDGADHLLTEPADARYAGTMIAQWASRYIPNDKQKALQTDEEVLTVLGDSGYTTKVLAGEHHLLADEPTSMGGADRGPSPYQYLAAGLGACTAITLQMYARRKEWPLEEVRVHLSYDGSHQDDCEKCVDKIRKVGRFTRKIELLGELSVDQKERLMQIADRCPVHKTIEKGTEVQTEGLE